MVGTRKRKKSNPDPDVASSTSKSPPSLIPSYIKGIRCVGLRDPERVYTKSVKDVVDDSSRVGVAPWILILSGELPTWVMMNPSSMFSGVESTCPTTAIDCFDELTRKIWRTLILKITCSCFNGVDEDLTNLAKILGVAWYKGNLLKGKFCFIQGDDYISTSGEALAL
ncbi:hypothetical protein Tco_0123818 [Tanacetum coccineum]